MSFKRFIIPDGDPVEQIQLLSDELRNAWDEAGQRRFRFMQYKRALRKFHLRSTDSDETRAILRMVSSNHRFHKQIFVQNPIAMKERYLYFRLNGELLDKKLSMWRLVDAIVNAKRLSLAEIEVLQNKLADVQEDIKHFSTVNARILRLHS